MDEHREHDDDGSLTQFVRQFRRLARLAAADPLRFLPPDPLTRLASLSAPVAALLAVAPFERLRHAIASPAPDARGDVARARLQPLVRNAGGTRPNATPALVGRTSRAVRARDAGMPTARHAALPSHLSDARSREEYAQRIAPSTATLAQRRAALRRALPDAGTPSQSSQSVSAQASTATENPSNPSRPQSGAGAPGASERVTDAALASAPRPLRALLAASRVVRALPAESRVVQREDRPIGANALSSAPAGTLTVEASHRAADGASVRVDAAIAPASASGFEVDAAYHGQPAAATGNRAVAPSLDARAGSPAAIGLPPLTGRAESRAEAETAGRPQSWRRIAELELADDLFEALYRGGVDLSWP